MESSHKHVVICEMSPQGLGFNYRNIRLHVIAMLKCRWSKYERFVKSQHPLEFKYDVTDIDRWKDKLFIDFLIYCFPVSFLALIPGLYIAVKTDLVTIAIADILCLIILIVVVFSKKLLLWLGKILVISMFYFLSVVLVCQLGYIGPGFFYLFGITALTFLIFPMKFAIWVIWVNATILLFFAMVISLKLFHSALLVEYTIGQWLTFSSTLIFLSIVFVVLIRRIFDGLQNTIATKDLSNVKYQNIFESVPCPMWLFDPKTLQFLDVNAAAMSLYGYTREEFMAMTIKDIRAVEIKNIVKTSKDNSTFYAKNFIPLKKNGEQINVKINSSLIDFNGNPAKLVTAIDISEQIKAEEENTTYDARLKESESNLMAVFESSIDGFVLLNLNHKIRVFNAKAKEHIKINNGLDDFEIGKSIFAFMEASRVVIFRRVLTRVLKGEIVQYDRKYIENDSSDHWVHYAISPVYEQEMIIGACITGRDVTIQKLYIQTIESQNRALREISWLQSHVIRAPLARIMGLAPMICNENETPEDKKLMIEYLQLSANELDEVIMNITATTTIVDSDNLVHEDSLSGTV